MVSSRDGSHGVGSSVHTDPIFAHPTMMAQPSGSSSSYKRSRDSSPRRSKGTKEIVKVILCFFMFIFCTNCHHFLVGQDGSYSTSSRSQQGYQAWGDEGPSLKPVSAGCLED